VPEPRRLSHSPWTEPLQPEPPLVWRVERLACLPPSMRRLQALIAFAARQQLQEVRSPAV
jgi:hypothetical protein